MKISTTYAIHGRMMNISLPYNLSCDSMCLWRIFLLKIKSFTAEMFGSAREVSRRPIPGFLAVVPVFRNFFNNDFRLFTFQYLSREFLNKFLSTITFQFMQIFYHNTIFNAKNHMFTLNCRLKNNVIKIVSNCFYISCDDCVKYADVPDVKLPRG